MFLTGGEHRHRRVHLNRRLSVAARLGALLVGEGPVPVPQPLPAGEAQVAVKTTLPSTSHVQNPEVPRTEPGSTDAPQFGIGFDPAKRKKNCLCLFSFATPGRTSIVHLNV